MLTILLAAAVAACGGGDDGGGGGGHSRHSFQIVSFGDSLSDAGTYEVTGIPPVGPAAFHGGRYTTNPGAVWVEHVARYYGDVLRPAASGGFGLPPVATGGMGYAQGGAKVSRVTHTDLSGSLALPIAGQIDSYLGQHGGFDKQQMVLLQGGGNDIIDAVLSAAGGHIPPGAMPDRVTSAARELAQQLGRVTQAGARRVVLLTVPDIGVTPMAVARPELAQALADMTALFNNTLVQQVAYQPVPPHFVMVDSTRWLHEMLRNQWQMGFRVGNTDTACSYPRIIAKAASIGLLNPQQFILENGAALLCAGDTLTEAGADQTYMFADVLHPSTRLHELYAQYVEREIDARMGF